MNKSGIVSRLPVTQLCHCVMIPAVPTQKRVKFRHSSCTVVNVKVQFDSSTEVIEGLLCVTAVIAVMTSHSVMAIAMEIISDAIAGLKVAMTTRSGRLQCDESDLVAYFT